MKIQIDIKDLPDLVQTDSKMDKASNEKGFVLANATKEVKPPKHEEKTPPKAK